MSKARPLHVLAYDIADDRRLALVLAVAKAYSTGGQKSVHECFLGTGERQELLAGLAAIIEPREDSVLLLRLDPRMGVPTLGVARPPRDEPFFYLG